MKKKKQKLTAKQIKNFWGVASDIEITCDVFKYAIRDKEITCDNDLMSIPICDKGTEWLIEQRDILNDIHRDLAKLINENS